MPIGKRGFTLVELMVVAALVVIIGSFTVANMVRGQPLRKLEKAQYQVTAALRNARMEAVMKMTRAQVTFNTSAKSYTIWVDNDRDGTVDTGESKTTTLTDMNGISMGCYPSQGTFLPNGQFSSSYYYQYVYFGNTVGYKYVYLFPSGSVDPFN